MNTVTPATITAAIQNRQPRIELLPGEYTTEIRPNYDCEIVGHPSGEAVVTGGISALGRINLTVRNCTIRQRGIACVDGLASCSIVGNRIEDVRGDGCAITADGKLPSRRLTFRENRVRRCDIGLMVGQAHEVTVKDNWFDSCYKPTDPTNAQVSKGVYLNDAALSSANVSRNTFTRCLGTSARGLGTWADDNHFENNGGTVALSANQRYAGRLTLIDSGGIDCNAAWATPCLVEDCRVFERRGRTDTAGIVVAGDSQYLSIVRPIISGHSPGRTFIGNGGYSDSRFTPPRTSRYDVWDGKADNWGKTIAAGREAMYGFHGEQTVAGLDNGRTLTGFVAAYRPDLTPTLDAMFEADGRAGRPWFSAENMAGARAWVRGEM